MKNVTLISDTHSKHSLLTNDLIGGDMIIHGGDIMTSGYHKRELNDFLEWFDELNYKHKIFIAGNHDRFIENHPEEFKELLSEYPKIIYLEDDFVIIDDIKIYGTPWQPEFYNWAFNLPRNGEELKARWDAIPDNTDILITHGPPFGYLDIPGGQSIRVGCELLRHRVDMIKPKIHVFGHIHGSAGYYFNGHTHFINAAILNEQYMYQNMPLTIEWDNITNEIQWL